MGPSALELIQKCFNEKAHKLDLGHCGLRDLDFHVGGPIDTELRRCTHLRKLVLSNHYLDEDRIYTRSRNMNSKNFFRVLPAAVLSLRNLTTLICSGEKDSPWEIKDLLGLDRLGGLRYLYLSNNQLRSLKGLGGLKELERVYLDNNEITVLDELAGLTNLRELNLETNRIQILTPLAHLKQLHALFLDDNQVENMSGLSDLSDLKFLHLNANRISDTSPLATLIGLTELALNRNHLISIPELAHLSQLQKLHLESNKIDNLDFLVPLLKNGDKDRMVITTGTLAQYRGPNKVIFLYGNQFNTPPIEVVQRGNDAIVGYFKELESQGTDFLYEAKMLVVGRPEAGKTSLRYKLQDPSRPLPKVDETTRGIDIDRLSFDTLDKGGASIKFYYNIWDFGGQQIYLTTHQFFLTRRSLYLLVVDTGKDSVGEDDSHLNYWLQMAELFGDNSPLLLIFNEKNGRAISVDIAEKKTRFEFIKQDYAVDLNNLVPGSSTFNEEHLTNFKQLKKDIEIQLERLPLVGFPMPKKWVKVREELLAISDDQPYISRDKYIAICESKGVTDEAKQIELSQILHDLGVFLHFQEYPALEDLIILKNTWATDAVFAVLESNLVKENNGKFQETDLVSIWQGKPYKPSVHNKLLALMMQFELCYQIEKTSPRIYIAPELLANNPPDGYTWEDIRTLPLQYRYDFMPKGVLTRFIVRLHRHIAVSNGVQQVWKKGVKINGAGLDCPRTEAEVIETWDSKRLNIKCKGPFAKDLLNKLTYEIDEINRAYFRQDDSDGTKRKSNWYKMIPCNCEVCLFSDDKNFYDYQKLTMRKALNKRTIECEKPPYYDVDVNGLIDGVLGAVNLPDEKIGTKRIFISYAKKDLKAINDFTTELKSLKQLGLADWYAVAGSEWDAHTEAQFNKADIMCLMISRQFLNNDGLTKDKLQRALDKRRKEQNFKIVPILLDHCPWKEKHEELSRFTALPYAARPIAEFKNQYMAWYLVIEFLRVMIEKNLNPTGDQFFTRHALPQEIARVYQRLVDGENI